MKNCYYLLLCSVFSVCANAQRTTDIEFSITSPADNSVTEPMESFPLIFSLKNNGPDIIDMADSLKIYLTLDGFPITFQPGNTDYILLSASIPSGGEQSFSRQFSFSDSFDGSTVEICLSAAIANGNDPVSDPVSGNNSSCVSVLVQSSTVSLEEKSKLFEIFPNPVSDYLQFKSEVFPDAVSIVDPSGRAYISELTGGFISLKDFVPGIYFLQIETTDGIIVKQFIKQ